MTIGADRPDAGGGVRGEDRRRRRKEVAGAAVRVLVGMAVVGVLALGSSAIAVAKGPPSGSGGGQGGSGGGGGKGGGGNGGGSSTPTGNDVSYPQCGSQLPSSPAFAIVGVNDGLANNLNPCLGPYPSYAQSELYWAVASTVGGTGQPQAQLYVNTADPGNIYNGALVQDWPTSGSTPYGSCSTVTVGTNSGPATAGANSDACAWEYGYERAAQDVTWLGAAASAIDGQAPPTSVSGAASSYGWWLDVETVNSWQADTTMNVADLEGMIAALQQNGATSLGVYSTPSQWDTITGGTPTSSSLSGLAQWVPGAKTLSQAEQACTTATSFTGGPIAVTQWRGNPDNDYAC